MRAALAAVAVAALGVAAPATAGRPTCALLRPPPLEASFDHASYRPGEVAVLDVHARAPEIDVQILRSAPEVSPVDRPDLVDGVPIGPARSYVWGPDEHEVWIGLGSSWPSGVYFARVQEPDGRLAFAPFVLRPRALGATRAAVVVPTYTWQAYNFRGLGSWYTCGRVRSVDLGRPYLHRGLPPHFRAYDLPFIQWLTFTHKDVDYLADHDLGAVASGARLRTLYDLVVFEGHEEYVTQHVYDIVERYRDLGGNLMFLSANSFFRHVQIHRRRMALIGLWRDEGRPEAALGGAEYVGGNPRYRNKPYRITRANRVPWLFAGTGLGNGDPIRGAFGIEIDARTRSSPPQTVVVARIPNEFGRGGTAEMTYYETARGAKVFAAGTLAFGGSAEIEPVATILENLWARLVGEAG